MWLHPKAAQVKFKEKRRQQLQDRALIIARRTTNISLMNNSLNLISGQKYKVIKPFTDYDKLTHPIGEVWIFIKTNFVPYDDGLTLHVKKNIGSDEVVYRLQWREGEQAEIIQNFKYFVEIC